MLARHSLRNLANYSKFFQHSSKRYTARWLGANFEGGKALMNEPGRWMRQKVFIHGERVFGFGGVMLLPFIYLAVILVSDKSKEINTKSTHYYTEVGHYPPVQRK